MAPNLFVPKQPISKSFFLKKKKTLIELKVKGNQIPKYGTTNSSVHRLIYRVRPREKHLVQVCGTRNFIPRSLTRNIRIAVVGKRRPSPHNLVTQGCLLRRRVRACPESDTEIIFMTNFADAHGIVRIVGIGAPHIKFVEIDVCDIFV